MHHFKKNNMQKTFINGSKHDTRDIMIRIDEENIEFFFYEQYVRRQNWIEEQKENNVDYLTDEDLENNGFYWINKHDWATDKTQKLDRDDNWHTHMKEKSWFTNEMERFLNESTNP